MVSLIVVPLVKVSSLGTTVECMSCSESLLLGLSVWLSVKFWKIGFTFIKEIIWICITSKIQLFRNDGGLIISCIAVDILTVSGDLWYCKFYHCSIVINNSELSVVVAVK